MSPSSRIIGGCSLERCRSDAPRSNMISRSCFMTEPASLAGAERPFGATLGEAFPIGGKPKPPGPKAVAGDGELAHVGPPLEGTELGGGGGRSGGGGGRKLRVGFSSGELGPSRVTTARTTPFIFSKRMLTAPAGA